MTESDIKTELAEFKGKVEQWMSTTDEYRKNLCAKIDILLEKINKLPCDKRSGFYESISNQVKLIWTMIGLMIGAIIAEWIKKH